MIDIAPVKIECGTVIAVEVRYPKTRLLSLIVPDVGYIMCGMLNIDGLDRLHPEREIIAARFEGVRSIQDFFELKVIEPTQKAAAIGIVPGITGKAALEYMFTYKKQCA